MKRKPALTTKDTIKNWKDAECDYMDITSHRTLEMNAYFSVGASVFKNDILLDHGVPEDLHDKARLLVFNVPRDIYNLPETGTFGDILGAGIGSKMINKQIFSSLLGILSMAMASCGTGRYDHSDRAELGGSVKGTVPERLHDLRGVDPLPFRGSGARKHKPVIMHVEDLLSSAGTIVGHRIWFIIVDPTFDIGNAVEGVVVSNSVLYGAKRPMKPKTGIQRDPAFSQPSYVSHHRIENLESFCDLLCNYLTYLQYNTHNGVLVPPEADHPEDLSHSAPSTLPRPSRIPPDVPNRQDNYESMGAFPEYDNESEDSNGSEEGDHDASGSSDSPSSLRVMENIFVGTLQRQIKTIEAYRSRDITHITRDPNINAGHSSLLWRELNRSDSCVGFEALFSPLNAFAFGTDNVQDSQRNIGNYFDLSVDAINSDSQARPEEATDGREHGYENGNEEEEESDLYGMDADYVGVDQAQDPLESGDNGREVFVERLRLLSEDMDKKRRYVMNEWFDKSCTMGTFKGFVLPHLTMKVPSDMIGAKLINVPLRAIFCPSISFRQGNAAHIKCCRQCFRSLCGASQWRMEMVGHSSPISSIRPEIPALFCNNLLSLDYSPLYRKCAHKNASYGDLAQDSEFCAFWSVLDNYQQAVLSTCGSASRDQINTTLFNDRFAFKDVYHEDDDTELAVSHVHKLVKSVIGVFLRICLGMIIHQQHRLVEGYMLAVGGIRNLVSAGSNDLSKRSALVQYYGNLFDRSLQVLSEGRTERMQDRIDAVMDILKDEPRIKQNTVSAFLSHIESIRETLVAMVDNHKTNPSASNAPVFSNAAFKHKITHLYVYKQFMRALNSVATLGFRSIEHRLFKKIASGHIKKINVGNFPSFIRFPHQEHDFVVPNRVINHVFSLATDRPNVSYDPRKDIVTMESDSLLSMQTSRANVRVLCFSTLNPCIHYMPLAFDFVDYLPQSKAIGSSFHHFISVLRKHFAESKRQRETDDVVRSSEGGDALAMADIATKLSDDLIDINAIMSMDFEDSPDVILEAEAAGVSSQSGKNQELVQIDNPDLVVNIIERMSSLRKDALVKASSLVNDFLFVPDKEHGAQNIATLDEEDFVTVEQLYMGVHRTEISLHSFLHISSFRTDSRNSQGYAIPYKYMGFVDTEGDSALFLQQSQHRVARGFNSDLVSSDNLSGNDNVEEMASKVVSYLDNIETKRLQKKNAPSRTRHIEDYKDILKAVEGGDRAKTVHDDHERRGDKRAMVDAYQDYYKDLEGEEDKARESPASAPEILIEEEEEEEEEEDNNGGRDAGAGAEDFMDMEDSYDDYHTIRPDEAEEIISSIRMELPEISSGISHGLLDKVSERNDFMSFRMRCHREQMNLKNDIGKDNPEQFQKELHRLRIKQSEAFYTILMTSNNLPRSVISARDWFKTQGIEEIYQAHPHWMSHPHDYKELSSFANLMLLYLDRYEFLNVARTSHQLFMLMVLIIQGVYHYDFGIRANLLITGNAKVGKTQTIKAACATAVEGNIKQIAHITRKAFMTGEDHTDQTIVMHEADRRLLGNDENGVGEADVNDLKTMISEGVITTESNVENPEGGRMVVTQEAMYSDSMILASNEFTADENNPLMSRMIHKQTYNEKRFGHTDEGEATNEEDETRKILQDKEIPKFHMFSFLCMVVEKMIMCHIIPDIYESGAYSLTSKIGQRFSAISGLKSPDKRKMEIMVSIMRTAAVMNAVHTVFCSPLSWEVRRDRSDESFSQQSFVSRIVSAFEQVNRNEAPENIIFPGHPKYDPSAVAPFHPSMVVNHVIPRLVITTEIVVFVLTLLNFMWEPRIEMDVFNTALALAGHPHTPQKRISRSATRFLNQKITDDLDRQYAQDPLGSVGAGISPGIAARGAGMGMGMSSMQRNPTHYDFRYVVVRAKHRNHNVFDLISSQFYRGENLSPVIVKKAVQKFSKVKYAAHPVRLSLSAKDKDSPATLADAFGIDANDNGQPPSYEDSMSAQSMGLDVRLNDEGQAAASKLNGMSSHTVTGMDSVDEGGRTGGNGAASNTEKTKRRRALYNSNLGIYTNQMQQDYYIHILEDEDTEDLPVAIHLDDDDGDGIAILYEYFMQDTVENPLEQAIVSCLSNQLLPQPTKYYLTGSDYVYTRYNKDSHETEKLNMQQFRKVLVAKHEKNTPFYLFCNTHSGNAYNSITGKYGKDEFVEKIHRERSSVYSAGTNAFGSEGTVEHASGRGGATEGSFSRAPHILRRLREPFDTYFIRRHWLSSDLGNNTMWNMYTPDMDTKIIHALTEIQETYLKKPEGFGVPKYNYPFEQAHQHYLMCSARMMIDNMSDKEKERIGNGTGVGRQLIKDSYRDNVLRQIENLVQRHSRSVFLRNGRIHFADNASSELKKNIRDAVKSIAAASSRSYQQSSNQSVKSLAGIVSSGKTRYRAIGSGKSFASPAHALLRHRSTKSTKSTKSTNAPKRVRSHSGHLDPPSKKRQRIK